MSYMTRVTITRDSPTRMRWRSICDLSIGANVDEQPVKPWSSCWNWISYHFGNYPPFVLKIVHIKLSKIKIRRSLWLTIKKYSKFRSDRIVPLIKFRDLLSRISSESLKDPFPASRWNDYLIGVQSICSSRTRRITSDCKHGVSAGLNSEGYFISFPLQRVFIHAFDPYIVPCFLPCFIAREDKLQLEVCSRCLSRIVINEMEDYRETSYCFSDRLLAATVWRYVYYNLHRECLWMALIAQESDSAEKIAAKA